MRDFTDKEIEELIEGIYSGEITEYELPVGLYEAIGKYLQKGLYHGFGMDLSEAGGRDYELLTELRENVWMFSAAKTFQEVKQIGSLLIKEDGDRRTQKEFKEAGRSEFELWNDTYGATEYNTAMGQAAMAANWNQIEENKKTLPMLRYSAVGDACEICAPLDGMVAPVDDPVWDTVSPLNHFNCLCVLLQEDESVEETGKEAVKDVIEKMDDVFKMNPGKDGYVFSPDHPYFSVDKKDKGFAKENFGLDIPDIGDGH